MAKKKVETTPEAARPSSLFGGDLDRLFDAFSRGMMASPFSRPAMNWEPFGAPAKAGGMTPDMDVTETDKEIRITAELPGLADKDVEVEMSGDRLTIKGEKKEEQEKDEKDYHLSERRFGSFRRSMRLPDTVDPAKVSAEMKNGVLTVTLPKANGAAAKPRKVAISKG